MSLGTADKSRGLTELRNMLDISRELDLAEAAGATADDYPGSDSDSEDFDGGVAFYLPTQILSSAISRYLDKAAITPGIALSQREADAWKALRAGQNPPGDHLITWIESLINTTDEVA
jgi:hypothetical protein